MEDNKIYVIMRKWERENGTTTSEEVARFYDLTMASLMLKALCERENYKAEVDFEHLDCIWAVSAVWTGDGDVHRYQIAEKFLEVEENEQNTEFLEEKQIFNALLDIDGQLDVIFSKMGAILPKKVTCEMEYSKRAVCVDVLDAQKSVAYAIEKLRKIINS